MSRFVKAYLKAKRLNQRQTPLPWTPRFLELSKEPSIPPPLRERQQPQRVDLAKHLNIKEGDLVRVLHGRDQNRSGIVLKIDSRKNTVIVEGCNLKRSFWSPRSAGPSILTEEMPIHITNVSLLDPITKRPTRVKRRYTMQGECVRISKISGCAMPEPLSPIPRPPNAYQEFLAEKAKGPPIKEKYANPDPLHLQMLTQLGRDGCVSDSLRMHPLSPNTWASYAAVSIGKTVDLLAVEANRSFPLANTEEYLLQDAFTENAERPHRGFVVILHFHRISRKP
ncbi:39S ribosomal protein L24, mitochondrial [Cyclospora cayetanensis]|uniref:Large ribosomal subunit protein uL24c n=1 Tax=Cyclospora cayetanensis TaxID=88456 RepID=A0A6P6S314_9EIME|nr:39S ribosomal protein L24, mitochondrial [Cyclospora cayetanensis]